MHLLNLCQGELHTVSLTEVNEVVLNWQFLDREAKLGRRLHSAKQLCLRLAEIWFQWKWDKVCLLVYFLSCLPCGKSCRQRAPESGKDRLDLKNRVYLVRMLWGHDSPPPVPMQSDQTVVWLVSTLSSPVRMSHLKSSSGRWISLTVTAQTGLWVMWQVRTSGRWTWSGLWVCEAKIQIQVSSASHWKTP